MNRTALAQLVYLDDAPPQLKKRLTGYARAKVPCLYLRDGELIIYKRPDNPIYQCRFKSADGKWLRLSTHKLSLEHAVPVACDLYDESRYRQRLGLTQQAHSLAHVAQITVKELRTAMDAGRGKVVYKDYINCVEKYFIPYFGDKKLEELTLTDIVEFEAWRNKQLARMPSGSTLNTYTSAWNKVCETAVAKGWLSERVPVPKLSTGGEQSKPRPAFNRREIDYLLDYMKGWAEKGRGTAQEMRPLLRDYVEMLFYTGMRHGTEAMNIHWKHIEWHTDKGVRYIRIWVSGKTGGRWLIAKHRAIEPLQRLWERNVVLNDIPFDQGLERSADLKIFVFSNGFQPPNLIGAFRSLMKDSGLLKNAEGQNRTLYSLRHTYATLELLENQTDIHTLAKQMGNSALMLEKHYSKLTATMAAERLA